MKLINNYKGKARPRHNKHVLKINALKTIRKNRNRLTIIGAKHIADTICVLDRLSGAMFPQGVCQFSIDYKKYPDDWGLTLSFYPHSRHQTRYQLHRAGETKLIAKQQSEKHSTAHNIKTNTNWNHIKGGNKNNKNNLETLYLTSQRTIAAATTTTKQ